MHFFFLFWCKYRLTQFHWNHKIARWRTEIKYTKNDEEKGAQKKQRIQFDMVHLVITFDDLNNAKQNEWMNEGAETIAHSNRSMLLLHRCAQLSDAHTHSITIPFNFIQSNWLSILFRRTYFTDFFLPLRFGRREEAKKKSERTWKKL